MLLYQESKRECCGPTFPPTTDAIGGNQQRDDRYHATVRKLKETCNSKKCKYAKLQNEGEPYTTQKLLDKIQNLKKNIRDLESSQPHVAEHSQRKDSLCQTQDFAVSDLHSAREALNNCIIEMQKLQAFLDDDNCWWKIFKKQDFDCCEQKLPHLHGFLDGTMVTLKMLEETLQPDGNFATSTPKKSPSFDNIEPIPRHEHKLKYTDQTTNTTDGRIEFVNPNERHRSVEFPSPDRNDNCHLTCANISLPMAGQSTAATPTISQRPQSWDSTNGTVYMDLPREMERRIDTAIKVLPRDTNYRRSSLDVRSRFKPKYTFSSENTAKRNIIAADISTSMDLLPDTMYKTLTVTPKGYRASIERNFSLNPSKMY